MEAFAAVASGAGLVSLAIQLLESSQKLKGLYNASRNAPRTIEDLCFELETLSLQLRQLESHRRLDRFDSTEILDRCIRVCEQRTMRVRDVVDAMARYMRRSSAFGGIYTAFKEPEMKKLLVELEQAKSSLSLAYISYCQSRNMRNSASQTLVLQQHSDMLALQHLQLNDIQHNVSKGNSLLIAQLPGMTSNGHNTPHVQISRKHHASQWKSRLRLPQWLTNRTWTLAAHQSHGSWTLELHPEIWRPVEAPALDCLRTGDITMLKKSLATGELSIWDTIRHPIFDHHNTTLLGLAIFHGQIGLCEHLLRTIERFRSDDQLSEAMMSLVVTPETSHFKAEVLELLAGNYNMDVDIFGPHDSSSRWLKLAFYEHSKIIMSHQPVTLDRIPLAHRFNVAIRFRGRSAEDFLAAVGLDVGPELTSLADESGGTALHWAARHLSIGHRKSWPRSRLISYENLIVSLIVAGSLVSAVDQNGYSPLMYLLDYEDSPGGWEYARLYFPDELCPVQIISSWGALLARAGVLLSKHVESENELLSNLEGFGPVEWCWREEDMELESITLSSQNTFTMKVRRLGRCTIWERRPPPGSFADSTPSASRILWFPTSKDDPSDFWFWYSADCRSLKSQPFMLPPDSIDDVAFDLGQILFRGSQDDHGSLASVYERNWRRIDHQQSCSPKQRRSASTPPQTKKLFRPKMEVPISHRLYGRSLSVHKCPLDTQWGFCPPYDGYAYLWATCMQGCIGRPDYGAGIVNAFLPQ